MLTTPEDRQGFAQNLFSEIVFDLDTRQIAGFKLKLWAEPFLQVRVEFNLRTVLAPEVFEASRLLTVDVAEESFLRELYQAYADVPRVRFRHLAKMQRNAEIAQRREEGETLAALAEEFGASEQRVWRIVRRHG